MNRSRSARFRTLLRLAVWGACMALGVGTGLALAAPDSQDGASAPPAATPATALEEAFGAPCEEAPPPSIALIAPLDGYRTQYLDARCAAAAGRLAEAEAGFRAGLVERAAVPILWRWSLLQVRVLAGDHAGAVQELEALLQGEVTPQWRERVRRRVAALVLAPGGAPVERHQDYLLTYLEHVTPDADDYDLLLHLWELAKAAGNEDQLAALRTLLWRNPKDRGAAMSWADVPTSDESFSASEADYYVRAERLFSLGQYEQLARELERPTLPELEPTYGKALGRLYFRALIRGNLLSHAAVQVNTGSVMRRFSFDRRQQLIWAIRIQLRRRLIGPVLKYLEELEQLSPQDSELPAIFLELLKYNQGRRDTITMMHWLERIVTEYGSSAEASEAYWQVVWDAIERRAYGEAMPLLDAAIRDSEPFHPVDQARLHYWRGRVQMRQGDVADGEATWERMIERWPYNYYTAMAEWVRSGEDLSVLHAGGDGAPESLEPPHIKALWNVEPFPEALFLFAVGEPDLASERLSAVVAQKLPGPALEEAGALFHYLQRHYLQLRLMANHHLDTLRTSRPDGSTLWRRAFPRPHWSVVYGHAADQQVDPYFVFAIMREESRFFTSANSTAGARGLMQLMPSTARMVAKRNGLPYQEDLLHTPEFNIPIGTLYLKRVLQRFDGNPFYAAAAYNAGPGNVRRWLRRYGNLPLDEFVERIPFGETQRYVKRVFLSYVVYTRLYR